MENVIINDIQAILCVEFFKFAFFRRLVFLHTVALDLKSQKL